MIEEAYVSFETAKLLKEKGFDEPCHHYYNNNNLMFSPSLSGRNSFQTNTYSAPTQQMAMKWLREVHNLHIWIGHNSKKGLPWYYEIHNIKTGMVEKIGGVDCGSYETACDIAIKYSLENLI